MNFFLFLVVNDWDWDWGTAPRWWCGVRGSGGRKYLSLVEGQIPGMRSGASSRFQLFVKVGARAPVSYGVDATLSDILMVNAASVADVFSLYTSN